LRVALWLEQRTRSFKGDREQFIGWHVPATEKSAA
jgi:hypothetical protein